MESVMAEIKIMKKKSVLPWIIIVIVLLAIVVYFWSYYNSGDEIIDNSQHSEMNEDKATDLIDVHENNTTVTEYINFIESNQNKMTLDHEFSSVAIHKLTAAVYAIADEVDFDIDSDLEKMENDADDITIDPHVTTHANSIRNAADNLTNALQKIQQAKYPGLSNEVNELRQSSNAINPEVLTLEQKEQVKSFFYNASHLLKKMN